MQFLLFLYLFTFHALVSGAPATNHELSKKDDLALRAADAVTDDTELLKRQSSCALDCLKWVAEAIGGQRPSRVHEITGEGTRIEGVCDLPYRNWNYGEVSGAEYRVWITPKSDLHVQVHTRLVQYFIQFRIGVQITGFATEPQWGQWIDVRDVAQSTQTGCRAYSSGARFFLEIRFRPGS